MAIIYGKLEFGQEGYPDRVFRYCNTTDCAWPLLYDDLHKAEADEAVQVTRGSWSPTQVAKLTLVEGHIVTVGYSLARAYRLFWFNPMFGAYERSSILSVDSVNHLALETDRGWSGVYDEALCEQVPEWVPFSGTDFEEFFGRPLNLCPHCEAALTARFERP
ncbi:hypothetical protein ACMHYO_11655 [Allopusillimonas ginsengisoli]|uniref:hypothetical protein n=1 Tax=Allopusillimonas ginsengisoli TaxID=453575 RepID=UPI0039C128A3